MSITTDDILNHHGVKGMKWGVRKKVEKKNMTTSIKPGKSVFKETRLDRLEGAVMPVSAIAILQANDLRITAKYKKRIAKAFEMKPKQINPKELRQAAEVVRRFSDVKISVDGRSLIFNESGD